MDLNEHNYVKNGFQDLDKWYGRLYRKLPEPDSGVTRENWQETEPMPERFEFQESPQGVYAWNRNQIVDRVTGRHVGRLQIFEEKPEEGRYSSSISRGWDWCAQAREYKKLKDLRRKPKEDNVYRVEAHMHVKRVYLVPANNKDDAIARVQKGEGKIVDETEPRFYSTKSSFESQSLDRHVVDKIADGPMF